LIEEARERALKEVEQRRQELPAEERKRIADVIGVSAIRYNIIRVQSDKKIVFKWEDALNLEGDSAPFIQYTYARASNILKKAREQSADEAAVEGAPELLEPSEVALTRCLGEFPDVIASAVEGRRVHLMAIYAHRLATSFNQFYRDCPVISDDADMMRARLVLVEAFRTTMRNVLGILGIEALESM
jgi:arginyl-tRNA synthetase